MPKGFFSQCFCFLTDGCSTIDQITHALLQEGFEIAKEVPAQKDWRFGGSAVIVPFNLANNGLVSIDVVAQVWPDQMGDPRSDPMTFGAWSMGYFGPFAYPGGMTRAQQQAWLWQEAKTLIGTHSGLIRVRLSYVYGAGENAPVLPNDYDPIEELNFLSRLSLAMLSVPGVICYFNPNGEVLCDSKGFRKIWDGCEAQKKLPLLLWSNVRLFTLNERFAMMDTVGNSQMDVFDVEAIYPRSKYNPNDIANYLRNVTHYLLETEREIQSHEAFDGPGETNLTWIVEVKENGLVPPPRKMLRLCPKTARNEIADCVTALETSRK